MRSRSLRSRQLDCERGHALGFKWYNENVMNRSLQLLGRVADVENWCNQTASSLVGVRSRFINLQAFSLLLAFVKTQIFKSVIRIEETRN